jgi:hypothetical protein
MLRIVALDLNAMVGRDSRLIARPIGDHIVLELDLDRSIVRCAATRCSFDRCY